jgi:DNA-binding SARP family transcriptional activator
MLLYQGDFLSDEAEEPWMVPMRERLRGHFLHLIKKTGSLLEQSGHLEKAIELYERALQIDHLAEEYYQRVMACQGRLDRPVEAMATYRRCRRALSSALGRDPSRATEAICEEIEGSLRGQGKE